ncbi:MAG: MerR family transcriptional regulator [Actinomycetota bacterium]|nr:MerR family transcriptional regulator [Actinomycetota bacterium]MDQ5809160.1 MerR family transcriptional regulator [Actinomycetota bacterium]
MRERLKIGEIAKLLGVTPKTSRHYEEVGLLQQPERTEAGYRLYSADDLLRLHRIKRLRSLGLSLTQVKGVLGEPGSGNELRGVLEALLREIEGEIRTLQGRRNRLREMLSKEDPEAPEKTPRTFELAERYPGEDPLKNLSPTALEQEKRLGAMLESLRWPEGYMEDFISIQESFLRHYAEHQEEYRTVLALSERFASLAELPEESPEVERLVEDYVRYAETGSLPEEVRRGPEWTTKPKGSVFFEVMAAGMSPAQRRFLDLCQERLPVPEEGDAG